MVTLFEIGKIVRLRRKAVGLTQERLAKLAGVSRRTLQRLEKGTTKDISYQRLIGLLRTLGLSLDSPSLGARLRKNGLWMAAKTSSVSYRREMSSAELQHILCSGKIIEEVLSNLVHFLDEAPISIVVMAVEETAQ